PETGDPQQVEALVAWQPPENIPALFPRLKLLFSVGAGADQFDFSALPPDLPVIRMIEPGLTQGMVEYVTFAVLGLHRDMPRYFHQQRQQQWLAHAALPASQRRVGVMGLGELGQAALAQLVALGFDCAGWSRTPRQIPDVRCWHGDDQLDAFLAHSEILVCLLPLTDTTHGLLNRSLFNQLPQGAALVQAGRGPQLNHDDLLAALESGQLSAAVIDVTDPEPLPPGHPFWHHPAIWLTPHIASQTQNESAIAA
ncbi:glyoxylate/hydroxypyruvate reductase A, partial [Pantoea allii]